MQPATFSASPPIAEGAAAEGLRARAWRILSYMGPAFLVSVGYMDPGNWATDIESGARFGYSLLWVLLHANLMAIVLQALSAKLGIVTGKSLPENLRDRAPRWLTLVLWVAAELSALATDLAEFLGAALGFNLLLGIPLFPAALLAGAVVLGLLALDRFGYRAVEFAIIGLVGVVGLAYAYELFLERPPIAPILHGLAIPDLRDGRLYLAIGIFGATVMPHNVYLHSALVQPRRAVLPTRTHLKSQVLDSVVALNLAFVINAAILIMSASTFFGRGVVVTSIEQAHQTLVPLLGGFAATAFALALLASGLASSATATLAGQVILQGFLNVRLPIVLRRLITMLPALVVIALQMEPLRILVLSQVFLCFGLPFAVVPLVWLTSRREVMGEFVNRRRTTVAASGIVALVLLLNAMLLVQTFGGGR